MPRRKRGIHPIRMYIRMRRRNGVKKKKSNLKTKQKNRFQRVHHRERIVLLIIIIFFFFFPPRDIYPGRDRTRLPIKLFKTRRPANVWNTYKTRVYALFCPIVIFKFTFIPDGGGGGGGSRALAAVMISVYRRHRSWSSGTRTVGQGRTGR